MGLDVAACSKATKTSLTQDQFDEDWEKYDGTHEYIHIGGAFSERAVDMTTGVYKIEGDGHSFRAGGYGRHNHHRNNLARIAGYPKTEGIGMGYDTGAWKVTGGPFWELILFSDCEGVIGPKISEKLYKDFVEYEEKIQEEDEGFKQWYADFKKAFELAKDGGYVNFG